MKDIDFRHDLLPLKDKLYRMAQRITLDSLEAEDVVEDTLVRVWEQREKLGEIDNLDAYCHTICRNLALDRAAKAEHKTLSLDKMREDTDEASAHEGEHLADDAHRRPDAELEYAEQLQQVHDSFNALPERQRTILHLRDIEGRSNSEIAEITGLSEGNIKVIISRARTTLRDTLSKLWGR